MRATAGDGDLVVEITAHDRAAAGELLGVETHVVDPTGSLVFAVAWGDSPAEPEPPIPGCAGIAPAQQTDERHRFEHHYQTRGTYVIKGKVVTGQCEDTERNRADAHLAITIVG